MQFIVRIAVLTSLAVASGCSTSTDTTATTPTSVAPVTTAAPGTVVSTTASTPTTTLATTTSIDRLTEIAAIFEDLERRRLQAIFDQDEDAFRAVHANETYEELSMQVMDLVRVVDANKATVEVHEILVDEATCTAIRASIDLSEATERGEIGIDLHVLELGDSGWGFSWTGEGWQCVGPHPLS